MSSMASAWARVTPAKSAMASSDVRKAVFMSRVPSKMLSVRPGCGLLVGSADPASPVQFGYQCLRRYPIGWWQTSVKTCQCLAVIGPVSRHLRIGENTTRVPEQGRLHQLKRYAGPLSAEACCSDLRDRRTRGGHR